MKQGHAEITSDAAVRGLAAGTVKPMLVRLKPDWCKGFFPEGAKITLIDGHLACPRTQKLNLRIHKVLSHSVTFVNTMMAASMSRNV